MAATIAVVLSLVSRPAAAAVSFGAKTDFATGFGPTAMAVADFDRDGSLDLAVANGVDNTVSVLLGTGTGAFNPKTDFPTGTGPKAVVVADFNGDAKLDLAVANHDSTTGRTISVLRGRGTGTFGVKTDFTAGTGPIALAVADLNGGGAPDLVVANFISNAVSVFLNTTAAGGAGGAEGAEGAGAAPFA